MLAIPVTSRFRLPHPCVQRIAKRGEEPPELGDRKVLLGRLLGNCAIVDRIKGIFVISTLPTRGAPPDAYPSPFAVHFTAIGSDSRMASL
jgi:hypothetical protein